MDITRDEIRRSFSRAARGYDLHSGVQSSVAARLAGLITSLHTPAPSPARILDAGCGTGELAALQGDAFPGSLVCGADISGEMASIISEKKTGVRPLVADLSALPFGDNAFELVASNMTLQWIPDLDSALAETRRVLAPGGTIAVTTLGPGTFGELGGCLKAAGYDRPTPAASFAPADRVITAFEASGLRVIYSGGECLTWTYADMWDLLRTVRGVGAVPATGAGGPGPGTLRRAARVYDERHSVPGGVSATYEVITVAARNDL